MQGVDAENGGEISGLKHLEQSIKDIIGTRIGTRVMRRDYGSDIPNLIDKPVTPELAVDLYIALAEALDKWEPRLSLRESSFSPAGEGVIEFNLSGVYLPDGKPIKLEGIVVK